MKLLWNLQLSSVDATTGKIAIASDSNWHFTKNCIKALSDMEHTVLIPQHESVLDLKEFIEQASTLKVNWKYKRTSSPYGVFSSRQDWNSDEMKEILSEGHYLVWENNPSLVMNWYTAAKELGRNIKVITYNHWIDNSKYQKVDPSITYQFRQHEAYYAAKKVGFNSEFGRQIALEGYDDDKIWSPKAKSILEYKSFVLPPIINEQEIDSYKTSNTFDKFTIVFNHRLSSLDYYKSNWNRCWQLFDKIKEICEHDKIGFQVIVTDNSKKGVKGVEAWDTRIRPYLVHAPGLSYKEYIETLWKSHAHFTMFSKNNGGMWSISMAEAILTNNLIVCDNHSGYKEMLPKYYDSGLIEANPDWTCVSNYSETRKLIESVAAGQYKKQETNERKFYLANYSYDTLKEELNKIVKWQ